MGAAPPVKQVKVKLKRKEPDNAMEVDDNFEEEILAQSDSEEELEEETSEEEEVEPARSYAPPKTAIERLKEWTCERWSAWLEKEGINSNLVDRVREMNVEKEEILTLSMDRA